MAATSADKHFSSPPSAGFFLWPATLNPMIRVLLLAALLSPGLADARIKRSQSAKVEFKRQQPCPATGEPKGPCKGWVIDHRIGLCVGGPDIPDNMMWMTVDAAKAKDRWECKPGWEQKLQERSSTESVFPIVSD